jgi:hypothetical protein
VANGSDSTFRPFRSKREQEIDEALETFSAALVNHKEGIDKHQKLVEMTMARTGFLVRGALLQNRWNFNALRAGLTLAGWQVALSLGMGVKSMFVPVVVLVAFGAAAGIKRIVRMYHTKGDANV